MYLLNAKVPRASHCTLFLSFSFSFSVLSLPAVEKNKDRRNRMAEEDNFAREFDVAVRVVHLACSLCQRVQRDLLCSASNQVESKDDDSLVTVADYSVQAVVSWVLSEAFQGQSISIVAEEEARLLSRSESASLLDTVVKTVNDCLSKASKFGLQSPKVPLGASQVLEAIGRCNSSGGPSGRHWVLDPVDGTLGFVRGNQYAVALALLDRGRVVIGVLGCPNYPVKKGLPSPQHQLRLQSGPSCSSCAWEKGCVMYAKSGTGQAWMQPLAQDEESFDWMNSAIPIHVSAIDDPSQATFCEPVENGNTSHSFSKGVAQSAGLRKQPLRVYSMVKYAAIACGDAEIYMKFASAGYKEKIWDHAAGVLIIEEAGGVVTDAGGRPLDFSKGIYLEGLDRGIVACSGAVLHEKIVGAVYASWESSNL